MALFQAIGGQRKGSAEAEPWRGYRVGGRLPGLHPHIFGGVRPKASKCTPLGDTQPKPADELPRLEQYLLFTVAQPIERDRFCDEPEQGVVVSYRDIRHVWNSGSRHKGPLSWP